MRKILIIMDSLTVGGAENQVISLARHINKEKFFITIGFFNKVDDTLTKNININNQLYNFERKTRIDFSIIKKINLLIIENKYDIVLCINEYTMLYAFLSKFFLNSKFKLITAIHHTLPRPGSWETIKNFLYKYLLRKCDIVLFVSQLQQIFYIDKYKLDNNITKCIHNGVDDLFFKNCFSPSEINDIKLKHSLVDCDFIIGNVAALRPEKKQEDIIQAARNLRDRGFSVKVLIVGDGAQRAYLEQICIDLEMSEHVVITGFQNDVRPFLAIMDCFVIASDAVETFSIAALEAMAMAKPLILSNIGGAAEMAKPEINGYLYNARDIQGLTNYLDDIINFNKSEEMGKESRKLIENYFNLKMMVTKYEILFG